MLNALSKKFTWSSKTSISNNSGGQANFLLEACTFFSVAHKRLYLRLVKLINSKWFKSPNKFLQLWTMLSTTQRLLQYIARLLRVLATTKKEKAL
jgi:hypothetical protein